MQQLQLGLLDQICKPFFYYFSGIIFSRKSLWKASNSLTFPKRPVLQSVQLLTLLLSEMEFGYPIPIRQQPQVYLISLFYVEIFHHKTIITRDTSIINSEHFWSSWKNTVTPKSKVLIFDVLVIRKKEMKKTRKIKFNVGALIELLPIKKGTNWLHNWKRFISLLLALTL